MTAWKVANAIAAICTKRKLFTNALGIMKNLKQFIQQHFESLDHCADVLDVSRRTVENYIYVNPCGILKHSGKIIQRKDVNPLDLFDAVGESLEQINENRPKN